jgi:hypothetical protein
VREPAVEQRSDLLSRGEEVQRVLGLVHRPDRPLPVRAGHVDHGLLDVGEAQQAGRGRAGADLLQELECLLPAPQVGGRPREGDQDPRAGWDGLLVGRGVGPSEGPAQCSLRVPVAADGVEVARPGQEVLDDGIRDLDDVS